VQALVSASTGDLRSRGWSAVYISPQWAVRIQLQGEQRHGDAFRFLGFNLLELTRSTISTRSRCHNGDIVFATVPAIPCDMIVYSGTTDADFLGHRLGLKLDSPFADYRFTHPETRWYNIASSIGAQSNFANNAPQILDFFAGLIAADLTDGRRPLLIAKKVLAAKCAEEIQRRLAAAGFTAIRLIHGVHDAALLADPAVIPIIHYGMIGTNLYQHFDAAYCLTSYYVTEEVVNDILQDLVATDCRLPIQIHTEGLPRRRRVEVTDQTYGYTDVHQMANKALKQQELDTVIQAVGRVRPYTQPRTIITFQCAEIPEAIEFNNLGQARRHFNLPARQQTQVTNKRTRIASARRKGLTQKQVSKETGYSLRTVQRYWKPPGNSPLSLINNYKGKVAGSRECQEVSIKNYTSQEVA
jgi:hypothetical protein